MNSLSDRLKESISSRHADMEEVPYVKALMGGNLPFNCYLAQLKAMAIIHGTMERELAVSDLQGLKGLILPRPSRFGHLRTDLSVLKAHAVPDCIKAGKIQAKRNRKSQRKHDSHMMLSYAAIDDGSFLRFFHSLVSISKRCGFSSFMSIFSYSCNFSAVTIGPNPVYFCLYNSWGRPSIGPF